MATQMSTQGSTIATCSINATGIMQKCNQLQSNLISPNEASFDPYDEESWFFGSMGRIEATELLLAEPEGVFIVRESTTSHGDLVLSVKESLDKVSHYIINKITVKKDSSKTHQIRFKIGDQSFLDVPSLLTFYKKHFLDTTSLTKPAKVCKEKKSQIFIDYLETLSQNSNITTSSTSDDQLSLSQQSNKSHTISISPLDMSGQLIRTSNQDTFNHPPTQFSIHEHFEHTINHHSTTLKRQHNLPRLARVIRSKIPNAYDKTALTLKLGDIIKVTETQVSGHWEGELNGKKGHFPFTHVEFIDGPEVQPDVS